VEALKAQFPASDFTLLAVVLALPLLGAFVNGVFGRRLGKEGVRLMALSAIGGAFLMSVITFLLLPTGGDGAGKLTWTAWRWFSITGRMQQSIPIDIAFSVDGMTATMMLVVTGVGFLIHLYSSEYMKKDDGYARFFAYLNLFCFAMLVLIMGDNLAVLFVGWEGVGMCSYLLIGFWFTEDKNASAGKKAFIVNRIGDFGLLVAIAMLVYYTGSLKWDGIAASAGSLLTPVKVWPFGNLTAEALPAWLAGIIIPAKPVMVYASTLVGLAVFLGCAGKSAQIPLYVWLPDAMAGPTPVSALIHAATMVTAGVYLVARLSMVFVLSPAALATVAVIGAFTAIFAASIGLFQHDLKKVLAYSTVSQLGFMFIGVGVGAFSAGFFHVFTHAFFKACLFLGAGSVIHAMHARIHDTDRSQDMRNMGGLKRYMPLTRWTFLIACCSIAGFPFLAGFWSKDEILWKAFSSKIGGEVTRGGVALWQWPTWLGPTIYWVGVLAATLTAFYMFRAYFMTFHGPFRGWTIVRGYKEPKHVREHEDHEHHGRHEEEGPIEGPAPHESPLPMTIPLIVLAVFSVFAGFLYAEPIHVVPLGHVLDPIFEGTKTAITQRAGTEGLLIPMMLPGVGAFLLGSGAAMYVYWNKRGAAEDVFAERFPRIYGLIYDKWRIDELYDATVVGMVDALADIFTMADKWIIDGLIAKVTAALVGLIGTALRALQTGRVQAYSASMVIGIAGLGWFFLRPHAEVTVDESRIRQTGEVVLSAAPGVGYSYRWEAPGLTAAQGFSPTREVTFRLEPGEKKDVKLYVRNAFDQETTETVSVSRPAAKRNALDPHGLQLPPMPMPGGLPTGVIPGDQLPELIRPRGAQ
jgi:NADH-quinone oxidoreductase subunit L